ncbi:hypothetical protein CDL15_Pgr013286 [Punica granatum]|uniref:Uncharacterized protein n=1 Tax=Punica granatum TaxID=22663 RepID=A0A218WQX6_PUNGR|nr:hypothetical protein CDL15_Pgr013286 [Punica granatum]
MELLMAGQQGPHELGEGQEEELLLRRKFDFDQQLSLDEVLQAEIIHASELSEEEAAPIGVSELRPTNSRGSMNPRWRTEQVITPKALQWLQGVSNPGSGGYLNSSLPLG